MNQEQPSSSTLTACLIISLCAALLTLPPFLRGYMVGHDLLYHINWADLFHTQLFEGDLYPRWLFDMKGGRGSPAFYFYSPLPYYTSAAFSLLLPTANATWLSLGLTYCFALIVSSLGVYWFLTIHTGRKQAFWFTLLYMGFPYHVVVDLYIRFAFSEFFAIAWIPYLFIFAKQLAAGKKNAVWPLAVTYTLLVLSHIPSTLLMTPCIAVYYYAIRENRQHYPGVITALAMGGCMAAFYLLPIVALKNEVSVDKMMMGHVYYENAFLLIGDKLRMNRPEFWSFLSNLSIASAVVTLAAFLSHPKPGKSAWFFFLACLVSIVMMFPVSRPIWDIASFLMLIQFPWRFFIVISFTLFFLAATAGHRNQAVLPRYAYLLMVIIIASLSVLTAYFAITKTASDISKEHRTIIARSLQSREGVGEYLPAGTPDIYFQKVNTLTLERIDNLFTGRDMPIGQSHQVRGDTIYATIENPIKQVVAMHQFYFPTWQGEYVHDAKPLELIKTSDRFLEFTLDQGVHQLAFTHRKTNAEVLGIGISLLALTVVVANTIRNRRIPTRTDA
jgi:hypothetical protein